MINISFVHSPAPDTIKSLRDDYLQNLSQPQELYLELFCRTAETVLFEHYGEPIGYFMYGEEKVLYEFHLFENYHNHADDIFIELLIAFGIKHTLCKSFDSLLLSCCSDVHKEMNVLGRLFRDWSYSPFEMDESDFLIRKATPADVSFIIDINENIFESNVEVEMVIENENLLIFERAREFIGFGLFQRVIEERDNFDIGMLVARKHRHQGYGKFIIQYLTEYCRQHGWRSTCGCAVDNVASYKCLESAGYRSRHRLLEFHF